VRLGGVGPLLMSVPVVFALVILAVLFPSQAECAAKAPLELLSFAFELLARSVGVVRKRLWTWLTGGPAPAPSVVLVGAIFAALACPLSVVNFQILKPSVALVWPTEVGADWVALGTVLATLSVGFLAHQVCGRLARAAVCALAIGLVGLQGSIAYLRVAEMDALRGASAATTRPAPQGSLVIQGAADSGASRDSELTEKRPDALLEGLPPWLALMLAALVSAGEISTLFGAFRFGGPTLAWIAFGVPLLMLCASNMLLAALGSTWLRGSIARFLAAVFS
jgi:hypothetical protein